MRLKLEAEDNPLLHLQRSDFIGLFIPKMKQKYSG
jgi:hypothetical protein